MKPMGENEVEETKREASPYVLFTLYTDNRFCWRSGTILLNEDVPK